MKKIKNLTVLMLVFCIFCLVFAGCGNARKPAIDQTTFQLNEDGTVHQTIIDAYADSFTQDDLEGFIREQLTAYVKNKENPEVTMESCQVDTDNSRIKVEMSYASLKDYAAFNNVTAFQGWLQDALSKGYDFSNGFVSDTGMYIPGYLLPLEYPDLSVLVLQEPMKVILPENVIICSDNITKNDDGSYIILKDSIQGVPEVFQSVNTSLAYLVYTEKDN